LNIGWIIPVGISALVLLVGWPIVSVPAGHTAVVDFYGHAFHSTLRSGVQFKMPFARTFMFSLKTQVSGLFLDLETIACTLVVGDGQETNTETIFVEFLNYRCMLVTSAPGGGSERSYQ
jgi:hypothetical protein